MIDYIILGWLLGFIILLSYLIKNNIWLIQSMSVIAIAVSITFTVALWPLILLILIIFNLSSHEKSLEEIEADDKETRESGIQTSDK